MQTEQTQGTTHDVRELEKPCRTFPESMIEFRVNVKHPHWNLRRNYTCLVSLTGKDITGEGQEACGEVDAAILSDTPRKVDATLSIETGDILRTTLGDFRAAFHRQWGQTNYDHLSLTRVP